MDLDNYSGVWMRNEVRADESENVISGILAC